MLSYEAIKIESALMVDAGEATSLERDHWIDYAASDRENVQGSDEPEDPDNDRDPVVIRAYLESIPDAGD